MALRFYRLDLLSMSVNEGFTWAAAAQPIKRLLQLQPMLDSGKLAVYNLLLQASPPRNNRTAARVIRQPYCSSP